MLQTYFSHVAEGERRSEVVAYLAALDHLREVAPGVAEEIVGELEDQRASLKLIASENYSSLSVQLAMGNLLTDKYSEGYPHHRFYAGCEHVDAIEEQCAEAVKKLFGAEHAYVQPHSGADANLVAFWAILTKCVEGPALEGRRLDALSAAEYEALRQKVCSQTVLGMDLGAGGHLTHGYRHNVSAKMMRAVTYGVDRKTGLLDYGAIATQARKEKPLILLAGYSAYPRRVDFAKMREIADEVGAVLMADMAHFAGLVAGKAFEPDEDPVPFADICTSTTHKTLRGPRGGLVLCKEPFAEAVNKGCPHVLGGPLQHVIAAKKLAFDEALRPEFRSYAAQVIENARVLAEELVRAGIAVATGGTDNHLVLVDLTSLGITGRQGESALRSVGLTANRNMVPFDPNGPWYTSGIRLGTPAVTTRGMGKAEMREIAAIAAKVLKHVKPSIVERTGKPSLARYELDTNSEREAKERVEALLSQFPLYPEIRTWKNSEH